jgi:hypothetical protein
MMALGGTMSEPDEANLARLLMRCALFLLSIVLGIFGATAILHAPVVSLEDLTMLLPSAILIVAPYVMGAVEAAWNLSLLGSALITVLVACLCTGLFFLGLGALGDGSAGSGHIEIKPALQRVLPIG